MTRRRGNKKLRGGRKTNSDKSSVDQADLRAVQGELRAFQRELQTARETQLEIQTTLHKAHSKAENNLTEDVKKLNQLRQEAGSTGEQNQSAYQTRYSGEGAYKFDARDVASLFETARKFVGPQKNYSGEILEPDVACTINFDDNDEISSNKLGDLLSDPVIEYKSIAGIKIEGKNYRVEPARRLSISLSERKYMEPVEFAVSGDRDRAIATRNEIDTYIDARRQ